MALISTCLGLFLVAMSMLVWKVTSLFGERLEWMVGTPLVPGVGDISLDSLRPLWAAVELELEEV